MKKVDFKSLKTLFNKEYNVLDTEIQRTFEWSYSVVETHLNNLFNDAKAYNENPKYSVCKCDTGTITRYIISPDKINFNLPINKMSYYIDDGAQRVLTSTLILKGISEVIDEVQCECEKIVPDIVRFQINDLIDDIKTNFYPQQDYLMFMSIMNSSVENDKSSLNEIDFNRNLLNAYKLIKDFLYDKITEDIDGFNIFCKFLINDYNFIVIDYPETLFVYRREKYNAINTVKKAQDELHRAISILSEAASKVGIDNFRTIALKQKGKSSNNEFMLYMKYRCISIIKPENRKIDEKLEYLANTVLLTRVYNKEFFQTFFDEYEFYKNIRNRKVYVDFDEKSYNNDILTYCLAGIIDTCSNKILPRQVIYFYYHKFLYDNFLIKNNCRIYAVKNTNENLINKLAIHIAYTKLLFDSKCFNNRSNDERSTYYPLTKGKINFDRKTITEHINVFQNIVECGMKSDEYQTFTNRLCFNKKGCRWVACLVDSLGNNDDLNIKFYNAGKKYFNQNYKLDYVIPIEHNGSESIRNLILVNTEINKINKKYNLPQRFIEKDNYSFPEELRGKNLNNNDIINRNDWIIVNIQNTFNNIFDYAKNKIQ